MRRSTQEILTYGVGGYGGVVCTGGSITGEFMGVQVLESSVFTALSGDLSNLSYLYGKTINAGLTLFGRFTHVDISSGTIIAYYA